MITRTVYLELQEIKANAEAILFSVAQLEAFMSTNRDEDAGGRSAKGAGEREEARGAGIGFS